MDTGIYCLMVNGAGLTNVIRNHLFTLAQEMIAERQNKRKIINDDCEGIVTSKGARASMGPISGFQFYATLETDRGRSEISYIIRESDIRTEDLMWETLDYPIWPTN